MKPGQDFDQEETFARRRGPPSMTVIEAIAEVENVSPTDLSQLNGVIDPDALNRLSSNSCSITFEYEGYHVTVRRDAEVILRK